MNYFYKYLESISNPSLRESIISVAEDFVNHHDFSKLDEFSLLYGHVQSGKTAHILGIVAKLADLGVNNFILLTIDNIRLQQQTYLRVKDSLGGFNVIDETNDVDFFKSPKDTPVIVVLKKNVRVLSTWRDNFRSTERCKNTTIAIVDDEADAASLNTRVNRDGCSRINTCLRDIMDDADICLCIQVTATPQAIILQSSISGWRPDFALTFKPGEGYLGNRYFFSTPISHAVCITDDNEYETILKGKYLEASGFIKSLFSYLINCAHSILNSFKSCNCLIHPGVSIKSHKLFAKHVEEAFMYLRGNCKTEWFNEKFNSIWQELQNTFPELENKQLLLKTVLSLLEQSPINVFIVNSVSDASTSYDIGFNVVIGGNSLGRGLTLPNLQTVYYCRASKIPQADTVLQHARIFGYDRVRGLVRIFIPASLHKLFCVLSDSDENIFRQISEYGINGVQMIYPGGIRPTRKCVVDKDLLSVVNGGVHYFPFEPDEGNCAIIDGILRDYDVNLVHTIEIDQVVSIIMKLGTYYKEDWPSEKFIRCLKAIDDSMGHTVKLIIRTGRDVSKGTGSLISPNDRQLSDSYKNDITLILYRLNGKVINGWYGKPFYVPDIKFPEGRIFYCED